MPIKVSGFKIGRIKEMNLENDGTVKVILSIEQAHIKWLREDSLANGKPLLVRKAKTIEFERFLRELNDIEEKLNKLGYSLRASKPVKIKYIYPREQFKIQKEMLSKDFLKKVTMPLPPQVSCESYSDGKGPSSGGPKDFVPLNWGKTGMLHSEMKILVLILPQI